jgi:hypothetical protein
VRQQRQWQQKRQQCSMPVQLNKLSPCLRCQHDGAHQGVVPPDQSKTMSTAQTLEMWKMRTVLDIPKHASHSTTGSVLTTYPLQCVPDRHVHVLLDGHHRIASHEYQSTYRHTPIQRQPTCNASLTVVSSTVLSPLPCGACSATVVMVADCSMLRGRPKRPTPAAAQQVCFLRARRCHT